MRKIILLPLIFILSLFLVNPIIFFEGNIDTTVILPLTQDSFVLAYCDEGNDISVFTIYNTTGEKLIGNFTIFANVNGCGNEGDSLSGGAFNSSRFVLGTQTSSSSDVGFQIFNNDGSNHTSRIVVDANVGDGNTNDISTVNESFTICWVDDGDSDERARCQEFDGDGNSLSGIITVSNADTNAITDVAVDHINDTAYFVLHQEQVGGQRALMYDSYLDNVVVSDEIVIDSDIGLHSEYDIVAFKDGLAGVAFISTNQVDCAIVDFDGVVVVGTTIIDASVSSNFENIQTAKINETSWILGWTDIDENATNVVTLDKSCGIIVSQKEVFDDAEQIIGVAGTDNDIGFCDDNVILAGLEAPDIHRWTSNHSNITNWDGFCDLQVDINPPIITNLINATTTNQSVIITWDTNELTNETSTLGVCPSFTTVFSNSNDTLSLNHIQAIDNLQNSTRYCFNTTASDPSGNLASDNISFITKANIPDTFPPIITLINPANNTATNIIPLNITFSVSDDSFNVQICILSNSTTTFDFGTFAQNTNSNLTLAQGSVVLDQLFPNLNLTCFDNSPANNSATLLLNYTLDTNPPIIIPIAPLDNEIFNSGIINSISIKANCTDIPVFNFNMTISNVSDTIAIFSDNTPDNNVLSIDENLIISSLGAGNYSINHTCADTHTKLEIADYNVRKNNSDYEIKWITNTKNQFRIKYLQNSLTMQSFGSVKQESGDRYNFFFNSNETESKTERTFIFEIQSGNEVTYLPNSKYQAHFIVGNNWIDFELDDPDVTYIITQNARGNWEVEVTTVKTKLNFNSIGELNIATITTQFEIFRIDQVEDLFSVTECRTDIGSVLLLGIFFLIAFGLILTAISTNIGFIGLFGALMLWITSWFITACIAILALLLTLLAMLFFFYFLFRGFFPNLFGMRQSS